MFITVLGNSDGDFSKKTTSQVAMRTQFTNLTEEGLRKRNTNERNALAQFAES